MSETKTAKQLEEEARQQMHGGGMFWFNPDQLKAYRIRLLQEQRELCARQVSGWPNQIRTETEIEDDVINAREP